MTVQGARASAFLILPEGVWNIPVSAPGGRFNKKISSYQYGKSRCGDKTILRPSYLHNGISYTGKMTSLYWIMAQKGKYMTVLLYLAGDPAKRWGCWCTDSEVPVWWEQPWMWDQWTTPAGLDWVPGQFGVSWPLNPLRAKFFQREHKHAFTFCVIPPHWYDTGT